MLTLVERSVLAGGAVYNGIVFVEFTAPLSVCVRGRSALFLWFINELSTSFLHVEWSRLQAAVLDTDMAV